MLVRLAETTSNIVLPLKGQDDGGPGHLHIKNIGCDECSPDVLSSRHAGNIPSIAKMCVSRKAGPTVNLTEAENDPNAPIKQNRVCLGVSGLLSGHRL